MKTAYPFCRPAGLAVVIALLSGTACNRSGSPQDTSASGTATVVDSPATVGDPPMTDTLCYQHTNGRDTIMLELSIHSDTVSGHLHFNNYQMDDSQGAIMGQYRGDTLVVTYDFHAEGTHSRQEEAFLRQDRRLIRGSGDREEHKGLYRFKDLQAVDFENGQIFTPAPCR